jgi:hypothetical protein
MLGKRVFANWMACLSEVFGKEVTEARAEIYYRVLSDLSDEEFARACRVVLSTKKMSVLPLPAEILEAARGDSEAVALMAFQKVVDAVAHHGAYASVVFDDPVIHKVLATMGGWEEFCNIPADEMVFRRKDFLRSYVAFLRSDTTMENIPTCFLGLVDRANENSGFTTAEKYLVYIGDREKAVRWVKAIESEKASEGVRRSLESLHPDEGS